MNIENVNPLNCKNWNETLRSLPEHSFFHTREWAAVLQAAYGYEPCYFSHNGGDCLMSLLSVMEIDSLLTGKRGVALPFTDYCDPVASDSTQFQDLLHAAKEFGRHNNWKYLEIRGGERFCQAEQPSEFFYGHILDLTAGPKQLFGALRDSTRRNIKKAEKQNIKITFSATPDALQHFCRLNALTRRDHGLPPQPRRFFDGLYRHVLSGNLGFIALASSDNHVIAANVYLHYGDRVIYKYGASDKSYQNLRANNLIMWESIKRSCDQGFRTFCFGRTEPENEGLRQFKTGWGAREYRINYYKYDMRKDAFVREHRAVSPSVKNLMRKLPVPALKAMGNLLYRHMG